VRADVATSEDLEDALRKIGDFKKGHLDALVTVGMCYEGMNVPEISHIACLTHIRSLPWIEQMIGRAVRLDPAGGPWQLQKGFIFAPDDPQMKEIARKMKAEEVDAAQAESKARRGIRCPGPDEGAGPAGAPSIIPHSSDGGDTRVEALDGDCVSSEESELLQTLMANHGIAGGVASLHSMLAELGVSLSGLTSPARPKKPSTATKRERDLKTYIQKMCSAIDLKYNWPDGTMNGKVRKRFGKGRPDMTEAELRVVWAWLQDCEGDLSDEEGTDSIS
jgi:hypothetical protein